MRKPWVFFLSLFALGSSVFVSGSPLTASPAIRPAASTSTTVLKALADPSEAPYFCSVDGEQMGIISDIAALLGKESQQTIEMLPVTTYDEYEAHLKAKDYDLLLGASDSFSPSLLSGYDLTNSYLSVSYSKATLRNNTKSPTTIACLGDNSMAGVYARYFYYANQIKVYETMDEALGAVKSEDCYAAIINSVYAQKLQNEDIRSVYSFTKLSDYSLKLKIAVKHAEDGVLLGKLNAAIASTGEDIFSVIVSRYSHFVKPTPTFLDQIYLNPMPYTVGLCSLILVFVGVAVMLFIASRRKGVVLANREFERFITYVCQNNEAVFEVNLQTQLMNHYLLEGKKVKTLQQPFSLERDFLDRIHPDERPAVIQEVNDETLHSLIATGGKKSFEARVKDEKDHYLWSFIIIQGIPSSRSQPANLMVFIHSIEEQKEKDAHAKDLLQNAVSQAETANKSKSEFLARMSHEIRTPLNAIIGLATIARHYDDDPKKIDDCLDKIDSSSQVLLSLINDILDMSAIENHKMKLASVPFDLSSTLENLRDIYISQCRKKKITLSTHFDVPDGLVLGDELRISQILLNLLSNAYKFTGENGTITFEASRTSVHDKKAYYRFVVKDTGVGISEEMQQRLFKPFEQENPETAQKYGGSGLGLSIVKSLVEMMEGNISVVSAQNKGTAFTVDVPFLLSEENASQLSKDKKKHGAADYDFHGAKVLLAEDNAINREIACELLKMVHIVCSCANNGKEAVDAFLGSKEGEYQLILMDIQMPLMNGYEAAKAIRASKRKDALSVPIYAMTANAYSEDVTHALSSGMNGHIAKPIDPSTLYQTIAEPLAANLKPTGKE